MTFGRGIAWVYDHMTRGLNDEAVDQIDAYLGDPAAQARVNQTRLATVAVAGVEVG